MVINLRLELEDLADELHRDNEKPSRRQLVPAFSAQARPITNGNVSRNAAGSFLDFADLSIVRSIPRTNT